jgi:hypothetical protein
MAPIDGGYWQDSYQLSFFNQEADVDFQYAMSLTAPQVVTNYEVGDQFEPSTVNVMLAASIPYLLVPAPTLRLSAARSSQSTERYRAVRSPST